MIKYRDKTRHSHNRGWENVKKGLKPFDYNDLSGGKKPVKHVEVFHPLHKPQSPVRKCCVFVCLYVDNTDVFPGFIKRLYTISPGPAFVPQTRGYPQPESRNIMGFRLFFHAIHRARAGRRCEKGRSRNGECYIMHKLLTQIVLRSLPDHGFRRRAPR